MERIEDVLLCAFSFQLREVALSLLNCRNASHVSDVIRHSTFLRWAAILRQTQETQNCRMQHPTPQLPPPASECCLSLPMDKSMGRACEACMHSALPCQLFSPTGDIQPRQQSCSEAKHNYSAFLSLCCPPPNPLEPSADPYITQAMGDRCLKHRLQRRYGWLPPPPDWEPSASVPADPGFCASNRTLSFFAMDTKYSLPFAHRLGLRGNGSSLAIVNLQVSPALLSSALPLPNYMYLLGSIVSSLIYRRKCISHCKNLSPPKA